MSSGMKERLCRSLEKVLHAETRELPAAAGGILLFFLLFLAYSMLRPVRETMGIAGGVQSLQWLFTATFAASIGRVDADLLHGAGRQTSYIRYLS